jgi:hypothetical protein
MTLTINDTTMTSDQTLHTARHAPGRDGWEVSWLPGRTMVLPDAEDSDEGGTGDSDVGMC